MANTKIHKPVPLRVIFILNALMTILPFIFYWVFTSKNITVGNLNPIWMVYTGIAYIISFVFLVYCLKNRKQLGARIIFIVNILIAIPSGAYIGILIAFVSLAISFFNKKVQAYFTSKF